MKNTVRENTILIAGEFERNGIHCLIQSSELASEVKTTITLYHGYIFNISYISFDEDDVIVWIKGLPTNIDPNKAALFQNLCDILNDMSINKGLSYCVINDSDIALVPFFPREGEDIATGAFNLHMDISLSLNTCYPLIEKLMHSDAASNLEVYAKDSEKNNVEDVTPLIAELTSSMASLCDSYEKVDNNGSHPEAYKISEADDYDKTLIADLLRKSPNSYFS